MAIVATPRLFRNLKEGTINCIVDGIRKTHTKPKGFKSLPIDLQEEVALVALSPVMSAVVQGSLEKTKRLIKENIPSSFLSFKSVAIDYSNRKIKLSPFQAAFCAWDDEMCLMFEEYMSEEEITRQVKEICPDGFEKDVAKQTSFDFSVIIAAIDQSTVVDGEAQLKNEQNDSPLCQAFNQFRTDFTARSQQEAIFNPQHLLKAFQLYDEKFNRWNWEQRDLFWRQVIGYVQRFLPANIAQDFAQGLYYRVEQKEKSKRSFVFRFGDGSIFPLIFDSLAGLGFAYAAGHGGVGARVAADGSGGGSRGNLQNLCRAKTSNLQNLCSHTELKRPSV